MADSISILLYGRDGHLLETRRWVLEASGYETWAAMDLGEAGRLLRLRQPDLMILCHSVRLDEARQAIVLAQSMSPATKCLSLHASDFMPALAAPAEMMSAREGPVKLLARIGEMLGGPSGRPPSRANVL